MRQKMLSRGTSEAKKCPLKRGHMKSSSYSSAVWYFWPSSPAVTIASSRMMCL